MMLLRPPGEGRLWVLSCLSAFNERCRAFAEGCTGCDAYFGTLALEEHELTVSLSNVSSLSKREAQPWTAATAC